MFLGTLHTQALGRWWGRSWHKQAQPHDQRFVDFYYLYIFMEQLPKAESYFYIYSIHLQLIIAALGFWIWWDVRMLLTCFINADIHRNKILWGESGHFSSASLSSAWLHNPYVIHIDFTGAVLNLRWDDFSPGSSFHNQLQVSSASLTKASSQEIKIKYLLQNHLFTSSGKCVWHLIAFDIASPSIFLWIVQQVIMTCACDSSCSSCSY